VGYIYVPPPPSPEEDARDRARIMVGLAVALTLIGACVWGIGIAVNASQSSNRNSASPTGGTEVFQLDRLYTYNTQIGHSKTTELTNDNVTVTLVSLGLSRTNDNMQLVVSFHDFDDQKGAHFLFQTLSNVYMIDDSGARYQATSATPDEVLVDPGQGGTVAVTLPLASSSATYLRLYFNTDKSALITPCVQLTPSETTAQC
jgi:hypothetical protein